MRSPNPALRESWLRCRRSLEPGLAHSPLVGAPLEAIDWAVAEGIADRFHASLSLDHLVISDRPQPANRGDKVVLIPKPGSVELRLYHDAGLAEMVEIDRAHLVEELDRLVARFR